MALEPDRDQIELFFDALLRHRGDRGFVSFRAFYEDDSKKPFRITPTALNGNFKFLIDVAEDDARRAAQHPRAVVFCPPLAVFANKDRAREQDIALGLALSVECDSNPESARARLEALLGPATAVVHSGGVWVDPHGIAHDKLHLHWRLAKPAGDKDTLAKLKQARDLAARLVGGDPTNKAVCHPIRWPGSWHRKGSPRLCEIETANPDQEIELEAALTTLIAASPAGSNGAGSQQGGDQKTTDWADVIDAILKGNNLHNSIAVGAAKLIKAGVTDRAAINLLQGLMFQSAAKATDLNRWQTRYNDIERAVRTAREKYDPKPESPKPEASPGLQGYAPRPFADIPRRRWLHAGHFVRRTVTMTVGPGGFGKTSLEICNAIEMVTGKGLIGPAPDEQTNVLYWCGEDEATEIERRIAAACLHHDVDPESLRDRLFLGNKITGHGRLASLNHHGDVVLNRPLIDQVIGFIGVHSIGVAIFDPLIAFHRVVENSTNMEVVVKDVFEPMAVTTDCCVELCVHTRKPAAGQQGELTADDTRGSSSAVFAARSVRVLNRMSKADAELPGINDDDRRRYLRVSHDKINLTPPTKATWIRLVSVQLPNIDGERPGDNVQAVEAWTYPQPFDKVTVDDMHWMRQEVRERSYRADPRAADWGGYALANRLSLDIGAHGCPRTQQQKSNRKRIAFVLKSWIANKALATITRQDDTRHSFDYLVPGSWEE
jgi:hypothetical protein